MYVIQRSDGMYYMPTSSVMWTKNITYAASYKSINDALFKADALPKRLCAQVVKAPLEGQ